MQGFGAEQIVPEFAPRTASEDFAFLLQARPGSFLFVGNGESAPLHSPRYVFNDAAIAPAASLWARLAELSGEGRGMSSNERFLYTSVDDPLARPLFDGLEQGTTAAMPTCADASVAALAELQRYPAQAFAAPVGAFVLLLRDGVAISGGAFMPHRDPDTAEFKRIWTLPGLRRQGIARRVLQELEEQAARQGTGGCS